MAEFKIITWNIQRGREKAWNYLLNELKPDVALIQEYIPDRKPSSSYIVKYPDYESDLTHRPAILIKKDYPWERVVDNFPNIQGLLCYKITFPNNNKIIVINIHAKTSSKIRKSTASTDHMTDILDALIKDPQPHRTDGLTPFLKENSGEKIVLGGDLNIDAQCDKGNTHRHKDVLERIENDLKFINCTANCENKQTHYWRDSKTPWQNDYLYVSPNLEGNLVKEKCKIYNTAEFRDYSDHFPVRITLDLPSK